MGDLSSQDSICRDMVAKGQTLQEQRDNMQAAYNAGFIDTDDNNTLEPSSTWGAPWPQGHRLVQSLGLKGWLSWYDTKSAALDALLTSGPQISMPQISRLTKRPPDLEGIPYSEDWGVAGAREPP